MNSSQDLDTHLANGNKQRIVYYSCKAGEGVDRDKQIVKALKRHIIGTEMKVNTTCLYLANETFPVQSLVQCVKNNVKKHVEDCDPFQAEKASDSLKYCDIKMDDYGKIKDFQKDDMAAIIIYASVGLVAVIFVAGSAWDLTKTRDQWKKEEGTGML